MTKSKMLRAGVIGAGEIGTKGHVPGFRAAGVEVVAICDSNEARAKDAAEKNGIPHAFSDYRELLKRGDIDVVSVGLPNALHAPVSLAALKAGKHVLCEKPMTLTPALARKMIATAKASRKVLSVNQHMRFDATAQAMRDIVKSGALGKVYFAESKWIRQQGIPGYGGWFTNKDMAGAGALMDIGVHLLDLILYTLDFPKVTRVKGFLNSALGRQAIGLGNWGVDRKATGRFDVDDTAMATLSLANGGQIHLRVTWAAMGPAEDRVTLYGERGGIDRTNHYSPTPMLKTYSADAAGKIVETLPDMSAYSTEGAWIKAIGNFAGAIRKETPLIVKPEQALFVIEVLSAIQKSAVTGKEVALSK
jgi:predicted dehydrogenase